MISTQARGAASFSSQVWWGKTPRLGMLMAKLLHLSHKPVLIISLPRSGSSWLGTILGNTDNALYLREPLSRSYLASGGTTTVFDVDPRSPPKDYALFAARAFKGVPVFPRGVVQNPKQWSLDARRKRTLVVKSVNPLALSWLLETYHPRVIYLVRHPVAVASSYWELGWRNAVEKVSQLGDRLMNGPLNPWKDAIRSASDFWQAHGIFQGAVLRIVTDALADYEDCRIITYEEICIDADNKFRGLIEFAGLKFDDSTRRRIADSSTNGEEDKTLHPYSTRRNSQQMMRAWVRKVNAEQLASLHGAYAAFGLPYYNSEAEWML